MRLSPRLGAILRVTNVFQPIDNLAVERFRNRNVSHRCGQRRAVPMFLARREPDNVARQDLLNPPALALRKPAACRHDQRVTERMRVPGGARAPGSKVTLEPLTRAGWGALNRGSIRTVPVNQSAGPFADG